MTEKINLFELDINIEALTDNTAKTFREIKNLEDSQKTLKKTTSELKKEIESYNKLMKEAQKANDSDTYEELKASQQELEKQYADTTSELTKNQSGLKAARKEYNMGVKLIDAYTEKQRQSLAIVSQTDGSIDQLSAALSNNKAVYKSLSKEERENTEIGGKLLKLIQEQDKEYKELHTEIGNTSVNVGTYKEQIKQAAAEMGLFDKINAQFKANIAPFIPLLQTMKNQWKDVVSEFRNVTKETKALTTSKKALTIATNFTSASLKLLKIALISTGIGAIVVLLGSLVAWFSKSQKGIDKFNQILAQAKAVVNVFLDRMIKLGGALVKLATFDFKGFKKDATDAFKGVGEELKNEIKLAGDLERKLQDVAKAEVLLDIQRAASKKRIKELNQIGEDTTRSTEERIAALEEATRMEEELSKKQLKIAEDKLAAELGELGMTERATELLEKFRQGAISADEAIGSLGISESNLSDLEKFRDLFVQVENQQAELTEVGTTLQNKKNTLINAEITARQNAAKASVDSALKESETRLKLFIAENQDKARTLEEQLDFEADVYKKQTGLLEQQLKAGKISQLEYDLSMIEAKSDFLEQQSDLTISYAEKELDLYIAKNKSKIDSETRLTESIVSEEERRLQSIYDKEIEFLNKQLEDKIITEQDYQLRKIDLQNQYVEQENNLKKEYRAQQLEQEQADFEMDMELRAIRGQLQSEIELQRLDQQYAVERQKAIEQGTWTVKQEQLYAEKRKQIEKAVQTEKQALYSDAMGNIASIMGEQTAVGKAAAVAQATIDTYMAANAAYSSLAGIPVIGPALGIAAAAAAIASGVRNVKKIVSTKTDMPKAEQGAVIDIGGKRHSAGGTKFYGEDGTAFEAERGEKMFILNRMASKAYAPYLSRLNQMYGGVPLSQSSSYLAAGGAVARASVPVNGKGLTIDYDLLAQKVAQRMGDRFDQSIARMPNPVTDVKDIISEVSKYNKVVNGASF